MSVSSLYPCSLSVSRGVYDIMVMGTTVGQYNNKGSFGELALMYNTPRAATIAATEEGALWGLVSKRTLTAKYCKKLSHYVDLFLSCGFILVFGIAWKS